MRLIMGMWQTLSRLTGLTGRPAPLVTPEFILERLFPGSSVLRHQFEELITLLMGMAQGNISLRRQRLLACGACRLHWDFLRDPRLRRAVEVSEHFADELVSEQQWEAIAAEVKDFMQLRGDLRNYETEDKLRRTVEQAAACLARDDLFGVLINSCQASFHRQSDWRNLTHDLLQGTLEPVTINSAWKRWNNGIVEKAARTIYDDGRFEELPILADALEEAGCDHSPLLTHLRSPGPHYRGCWALDAILEQN